MLRTGAALAPALWLAGCGTLASTDRAATGSAAPLPPTPAFVPVPPQFTDAFVVASGYTWDRIATWGDALFADVASLDPLDVASGSFLYDDAAQKQARRFGANCDALAYFPLVPGDSARGVLCINHEYITAELTFTGLPASGRLRAASRRKWIEQHPGAVAWMQAAHGVSVVHVARGAKGWQIMPGNNTRRVTANTPCEIAGPARGAELLRTNADRTGTLVLGTFANCAGGKTPWGTYLTAEENFPDYFGQARSWAESTDDMLARHAQRRFHAFDASPYGWEHADPRFDARVEPREPLRFGWIVEIDPQDPAAAPRKRTALGRFMHEGANTILAPDGRVVAYMGDDEQFEYLYKFVTRAAFDPKNPAANRDLLDDGILYAARLDADGRGEWLPLVLDDNGPLNAATGFHSQADVVIRVREAADLLGATPMDRPEDVEPSPVTGRVYVACTKNTDRQPRETFAESSGRRVDFQVNTSNPRPANELGHIVELIEADDDAAAMRFRWNVFLLAGNPTAPGTRFLVDATALVPGQLGAADTYYAGFGDASSVSPIACPDNLGIDPTGRLWIVSDSNDRTRPNNGCFVVPTAGRERGMLRQLASGPRGCELCGCEFTPDGTSLFLSVQHPGEGGTIDAPVSHWPDGGELPARSTVIAVRREDGGPL